MSDRLAPAASALRRYRIPLMVGVPLVVVLAAAWVWATGGRYVSTDNAFVQTGRVQISSNVSGHVIELAVRENQHVHKGDLLFRLENSIPHIAIEQATAQLDVAQAQVEGYRASYREAQAELAAAQANLAFRQREAARNKTLSAAGAVSKEEADAAAHEADLAAKQIAAVQAKLAVTAANLGGRPDIAASRLPLVQQARAQLDRAHLQEADTIIRAPQDGVVTKVSQLQLGSYVQAASPVFSLVTDEIWVDANFKESDLAHMRPGQRATVKIDAHPDLKLEAAVQSLSPGTGSSFALLPAENATGNWVKVVQRVPVRMIFTRPPPIPLQAGLSAVVTIDTGHSRMHGAARNP